MTMVMPTNKPSIWKEFWALLRFEFFLWRRGMKIIELEVRSPWALSAEKSQSRRKKNRQQRKARRVNRLRRK